MRDEALSTDVSEARREARLVSRGSGSYSGTQATGHLAAGEMQGGVFVPYGRVGITEPKNGFLPRRTS